MNHLLNNLFLNLTNNQINVCLKMVRLFKQKERKKERKKICESCETAQLLNLTNLIHIVGPALKEPVKVMERVHRPRPHFKGVFFPSVVTPQSPEGAVSRVLVPVVRKC